MKKTKLGQALIEAADDIIDYYKNKKKLRTTTRDKNETTKRQK